MRTIRAWLLRFGGLFNKQLRDRELTAELESHLQMQIEDNLRSGINPAEARRQALLRFGGVESAKETYRDRRGIPWLESLFQDIRFALRVLRKNLGFTLVAVLTLALGIGANTAMFSVVEGVTLAPLPYLQPDRLVMVWLNNLTLKHMTDLSYPDFLDWQRSARSFQQMAAFVDQGYNLTGPGTPEHLDGREISGKFLSTLGVRLSLGREFSAQEDQPGGAAVVIINDRLWRYRFNSSPAALGQSLNLDGAAYTIVGVLPPQFHFWKDVAVYTPLGRGDSADLNSRTTHDVACIARLKSDVSISQAQAEMEQIQQNIDRFYPNEERGLGAEVMPLKDVILGQVPGTLLLLFGAVAVVLLIACANLASLLLARSAARTREFSMRSALGAGRTRIVQQLLTESVLLSFAGGVLGLLVAKCALTASLPVVADGLPLKENIGLNVFVLLFTLGMSIAVGIVFGLAPALKSSKLDCYASLKEGDRTLTSAHHRVQSSFVIVQMTLTVILLVGASLLFRTVRHLWQSNPGFTTEGVITFKVGLSPAITKAGIRVAYQHLLERIRQIPSVQAADLTGLVPLSGEDNSIAFWLDSQRPVSIAMAPRVLGIAVGTDYLRAMGIPLMEGRFFTMEDDGKSALVIVIDSDFAKAYFPNQNPIGHTISFPNYGPYRIIGVAGHIQHWGLGDSTPHSTKVEAYASVYQFSDHNAASIDPTLVVRTSPNAANVIPAIKAVVYGADSAEPLYDLHTMQEIVSNSMSSRRFPMILLATFAGLALLLASVGIYGLISHLVTQRVHEIGIRLALGADKSDIFRMVIGQGFRLALLGLAFGVAASLMLTRLLSSFSHLLFGVRTNDPLTFIVVSVVLTVVSIFASYIPARRATLVDPMVALRHE